MPRSFIQPLPKDADPLILALIAERERQGLGIRELARRAGIGHYPGRLSQWELCDVSPTLRGLRMWVSGLGCDIALITPRHAVGDDDAAA